MTKQEGPGIPSPSMGEQEVALPEIVSRDEWQAARRDLLVEEKASMKARDGLAAKRRRLPMIPYAATTASSVPTARWTFSACSPGGVS